MALIFTAAFTLRVIPLIFWPSIAVPDEILQSVEQGHRLAFGYGLVPWEFEYAARSWLLAYASAGLMWLASLMGDGPAYYLPLIGATCAALSAATAVCAFLWGNRFYGIRGGLLSAMVPMTSLDDIYFGARTSSEAVAAHILVIAVYLLAPGDPVKSRWRLASAGFLLALTSVIRIQLLPAIALAFLWGDRATLRHRILPLAAGALAAFALDGWFDAMTWRYPFEPLFNYLELNLVRDVGSFFGTQPWWRYAYWLGAYWGWMTVILLPLAFLGGRKAPLLLAMALTIIVAHSFIPHKEFRYIYPAIPLLTITAGFGLVEFLGWLTKQVNALSARHRTSTRSAHTVAAACWLLLAGGQFVVNPYRSEWNHDSVLASLYVSEHMASACGIGLYGLNTYAAGGYTYLHRRVPLYEIDGQSDVATLTREAASYNVMMSDVGELPRTAPSPEDLGYKKVNCFGRVCVALRSGDCQTVPMRGPGAPPPGLPVPPPYPQSQGIM